ncbi:MAG: CotH kinase family protein [Lachnospiraceae bacterium]|nr:CotH kinase family protein [Lachnospiraceae bacterium]
MISAESGFYDEDLVIELTPPIGKEIFYTTDYYDNDDTKLIRYTEPLYFKCEDNIQVIDCMFVTKTIFGNYGEPVYCTYIIGKNVKERFDVPVVTVWGDEDELFGYENGILNGGALLDDYIEENNPELFTFLFDLPANFNKRGQEYERKVNTIFFDTNGSVIIDKAAGLRTSGGTSRMNALKNIRLISRREYDNAPSFEYSFFDTLRSADNAIFDKYKNLIFKGGGTDNVTYMRNELSEKLLLKALFCEYRDSFPVALFINGKYMGLRYLGSFYDEKYFEERYGNYDGSFVVLEGTEWSKYADKVNPEEYDFLAEEYDEIYGRLRYLDLTDDENFRLADDFMDTSEYLKYYAFLYYMGDDDWPDGNYRLFRYYSPEDNYIKGTVFDGRYRYIPFDMDQCFGYRDPDALAYGIDWIGVDVNHDLYDMLTDEDDPSMFDALLKREDCRQVFISFICDLMNGPISSESVSEEVSKLHAKRYNELSYTLADKKIMGTSLFEYERNNTMEKVEKEMQVINDYAVKRPAVMKGFLKEHFNVSDLYTLTITNEMNSGCIKLNTLTVTDKFEGEYYGECDTVLYPITDVNEEFDHWDVNGKAVYDEKLIISAEDIIDGKVDIRAYSKYKDEQYLNIDRLSAKGANDYIVVKNNGNKPISTKGYYLGLNGEKHKYEFPQVVLSPGKELKIYCENYQLSDSLGGYAADFSLKRNDELSLNYLDKCICSLTIPDLAYRGGTYAYDVSKQAYSEIPPELPAN